jgi:hypothetical protein
VHAAVHVERFHDIDFLAVLVEELEVDRVVRMLRFFTKEINLSVTAVDNNVVNYPPPKGGELLVFASTEPLVLTQ